MMCAIGESTCSMMTLNVSVVEDVDVTCSRAPVSD